MPQKPQPERKEKGEEGAVSDISSNDHAPSLHSFKELAERLMRISKQELAEQEAIYNEKKKTKVPSRPA